MAQVKKCGCKGHGGFDKDIRPLRRGHTHTRDTGEGVWTLRSLPSTHNPESIQRWFSRQPLNRLLPEVELEQKRRPLNRPGIIWNLNKKSLFYVTDLAFSGWRSASVSVLIGSFTCAACSCVSSVSSLQQRRTQLRIMCVHRALISHTHVITVGQTSVSTFSSERGRVQGSITNFIMGLKAL